MRSSRTFYIPWRNLTMWALLVVLIFLVTNLCTIGQYGMTWDESFGMERGENTIASVKQLVVGHQQNNFDRPLFAHPAFYATCNYLVAEFMIRWCGWKPLPAGHLLNLVTATGGLLALFFFGRTLFSPTVGFVAVLFMVLFPRFIAHAHANPKDIPVMVFAILTLMLLYRAAESGSTPMWLLAALSCAMTVTSKLDGLFLLPIFFIPWLLTRWRGEMGAAGQLRNVGWFFYALAVFVYILWPEIWLDPLHMVKAVEHFTGYFLNRDNLEYLGHSYALDKIPWHYLPLHLVIVTPLLSLMFFLIGSVSSIQMLLKKEDVFKHSLLWCWLLIPLMARWVPGTIQYDGMRHVFIVVPAMALLAAFGTERLLAWWQSGGRPALVPAAASSAILVWLGWQSVQIHPLEAYYLNEVTRSVVSPAELHRNFDFHGYGMIFKYGIDWVNAFAPAGSSVALGHDDNHDDNRQDLRPDLRWQSSLDPLAADFIIVAGWRPDLKDSLVAKPVFTLQCYGADVLWVLATTPAGQPSSGQPQSDPGKTDSGNP